MSPTTVSFPALGTTATLCVTDPDTLGRARTILDDELREVDTTCSRFRPDSELVRLNARAGRWVVASPRLFEAIGVALDAAAVTDGLVDPTIGRALALAGYDQTFEIVKRREPDAFNVRFAVVPGWRRVEIDHERRAVRVPPGTELDLGATAKALAVDRAVNLVVEATGGGALVSLGGDVAVAGESPDPGWSIRVADDHAAPLESPGPAVTIRDGAIASSGTTVRRWYANGVALHHILDPRTGRPAVATWRTVTVAAQSCVDANIASTAAIVIGDQAPAWLQSRHLPARLASRDSVVFVGGWPEESE